MLIPCDIDGQIEERDDSTLRKVEGAKDDAIEYTTWVEYWTKDTNQLVHRSVHVTLKKNVFATGLASGLR